MSMVQLKQFTKETFGDKVTLPIAKERESSYPFQWLLFKPQAHAVQPFAINKATRSENTARSGDRTHADTTSRGS
jgi:hypothetical protein